jgi:protein-S-isoprenylcysteine O-methyltransferase Ste14
MRKLIDSAWALIVGWLLLSFWLVTLAAGPVRRLSDTTWLFIIGWVLLIALAAAVSKCLPHDYRTRLRPGFWSFMVVKAFSGVYFTLLVVAAIRSTWRFSLPAPLALVSAILLIAAGTAICLAAVYAYGGSVMRLSGLKTDRLVTEGIYRWSRNPQLVGSTVILVGVGLIRQSGMVLVLTVFFWLAVRLYLPVEEELLERLYGDAYQHYRLSTGRYFGRRKANVAA